MPFHDLSGCGGEGGLKANRAVEQKEESIYYKIRHEADH